MKIVFEKKVFFISLIGFLYFAVGDLSRLIGIVGIPREIPYSIFFLLFLMFIFQRIRKIELLDFVIIILILGVTLFGTIRYGGYIESITSRLAPLLIFFPSYIFFRLYDFEKIEYIFEKAALFSGVFLLVYYILFVRNSGVSYNMSYAYWVSFPTVCFAGLFFKKNNYFYLIADLLMLITLLLSGCRGALILTIISLIYIIATESFRKGSSTRKIITIVVIGIIAVGIVYFSDSILLYLSRFSSTSRNIRMLLNGSLLESKSRDNIHEICKQLIDQNGWGYGPLASRKLLYGHNYPHSLWYELQLDYGHILGIVFFVIIMFMNLMNIVRYSSKNENILIAFISIVGIGSLMVSSSYFYEIYVPATIAMFINWNKKYKNMGVINSTVE